MPNFVHFGGEKQSFGNLGSGGYSEEVGATVRTPQGSKRSRLWQPGSDLSSARKSVIKCYGNEKREWALWSTDSVRTYLFIIVVHGHQRAALSSRKLYLCHKPDRLIFWIYCNFFFFQMHFAHISVIHILKAMGLRNTLVIQHLCHGLKYRLQEFFLRSGLKLDLNLTPSHTILFHTFWYICLEKW